MQSTETLSITGKNIIGNSRSSLGTVTFKTFNPILNQETPYTFTEASKAEVDQAVTLATEAFKTYRNTSGKQKAAFLRAIADRIMDLGDTLIQTYCEESGLPEGRAIGERGRTIGQLQKFADFVEEGSWVEATIDTADSERQPPKPDLRKMLVPLGPVVVFGASNFPLAFSTAGGDTAAALAAGCPVIVKSHPMHAGTGELVAGAILQAAVETDMPNGIFSNLNSAGIDVGIQLVEHPGIKAVGFTGSIKAGRALYDLAAKRKEPIPVFAEMGSINPVILLPEAIHKNSSELAATYAQSITLGSGQFCTNPGLLIGLKGEELDQFVKQLGQNIEDTAPSSMLHPHICKNYLKNKSNTLEQAGVSIEATVATDQKNFGEPAIAVTSGSNFLQNPKLHEEVFGPFSLVVECTNLDELNKVVQQLNGQLTGTVLASEAELEKYDQTIKTLQNRVGRIIFNGAPTGVEVSPAMEHGGPYPASTDSRFTSVGVHAIKRWVRPLSFQNWPNTMLPDALKNENPLEIMRNLDGNQTYQAV